MISNSTAVAIPRPYCNWYQKIALQEFIDVDLMTEDEATKLNTLANEVCNNSGYVHVGWAAPKPKYLDLLGEAGLALLAVGLDSSGNRTLLNLINVEPGISAITVSEDEIKEK